MYLIDTHAHLYSDDFTSDLDLIIEKCKENNIQKVFLPSIDETYLEKMFSLKKQYPHFFYLMIGIHPSHIDENYLERLKIMENLLIDKKEYFIGIGEIGIDLYWDKTKLSFQKNAFEKQLDLSLKYNLPINIHCRDAFSEVFEVLEKYKNIKGVFHCFSGNLEQAKFITQNLNLKLGIGGIVTFKNGGLNQFINEIDLKNIVLETDSPYLAPSPYRGKRNDSSFLTIIASKLSELYNLSYLEITEITTNNVKEIYNLN